MSKDGCENDNRREFTQLGAVHLRCVFSAQLLTIWLFHLNFVFRTILAFGRNSALSIIDRNSFGSSLPSSASASIQYLMMSGPSASVRPLAIRWDGRPWPWPACFVRPIRLSLGELGCKSRSTRRPQGQACKIVHTTTCTVNVCRMSHRKQREIKQQLIRLPA